MEQVRSWHLAAPAGGSTMSAAPRSCGQLIGRAPDQDGPRAERLPLARRGHAHVDDRPAGLVRPPDAARRGDPHADPRDGRGVAASGFQAWPAPAVPGALGRLLPLTPGDGTYIDVVTWELDDLRQHLGALGRTPGRPPSVSRRSARPVPATRSWSRRRPASPALLPGRSPSSSAAALSASPARRTRRRGSSNRWDSTS